jgi:hypothetical protein
LSNVGESGLSLRLPPEFEERDSYGCYHDDAQVIYGSGWRDFCISVLPEGAEAPSFEAIDHATRATDPCLDCMSYEQISEEPMRLGTVDADVQLALGTGGIGHKERRPELLVTFPLGQDVVVVRGEFGDARDAELILGIVGTIEAR